MTQEYYGPTRAAEQRINRLLSLPASGREQDWEFELADPDRIGEMLNAASTEGLSHDERCALALLTIASIEEWNETGRMGPNHIAPAKDVLRRDGKVREAMIFYWIDQRRAADGAVVREILMAGD